jgi:hypothetical protein
VNVQRTYRGIGVVVVLVLLLVLLYVQHIYTFSTYTHVLTG